MRIEHNWSRVLAGLGFACVVVAPAFSGPALAQDVRSGQPAAEQRYVCVKKWGIRRNEGYCGLARERPDGQVAIRILRINRTVWRTRGTPCSGGFNLKDLIPGVTIVVPDRCL